MFTLDHIFQTGSHRKIVHQWVGVAHVVSESDVSKFESEPVLSFLLLGVLLSLFITHQVKLLYEVFDVHISQCKHLWLSKVGFLCPCDHVPRCEAYSHLVRFSGIKLYSLSVLTIR